MNILINESQYNRLFKPKVKITLLEGDEAQKYLDYTYLDDEKNLFDFLNEQEYTQEELDKIKKNKEIEDAPNLSRGSKDDKILELNNELGLENQLQEYAEDYYNSEHNNFRYYKFGNKKFTFRITKHWAARLFRDPLKPIQPLTKGIDLIIKNIDRINEFINRGNIDFEKSVIVLNFDGELYNEVITIRNEISLYKNMFKIIFVTQLNKKELRNKYSHPILRV